jgi:anaerobic magnesium-protoporphyrin IX monomethyl ester cyclase
MYAGDKDLELNKNKMFFAGRGCPYNCTYCFNHRYNRLYKGKGNIIRRRSVDNIIQEIIAVKERYPMESLHFADDIFLLSDMDWMKEFSKRYRKEVNVPFICHIRANLVEDEIISLIKDAGCYSGFIGVECGDEEISKTLLKRNLSNEQIIRACKILKKYGIKFCTQNLMVLPVENPLEVDMKTRDLNIQCDPDFAWSSILFPYPRTEMGEYCVEKGFFHGNFDDIPETNKTVSTLHFRDQRQKKLAERQHKLFGLAVEFKIVRLLTNFLIRLPLDKFYLFLFFMWYGFCLRLRLEKPKKKTSDFILLGKNFFSYMGNQMREIKAETEKSKKLRK